jgi:hypothetical protein
MGAEHRDLATKCTTWWDRLSGGLVHNEREHKVRWCAPLQRNQSLLGPSLHIRRQLLIRRRALEVFSDLDVFVELLEELERDLCNAEAADEIPRNECVKNLLGDVESCEVLHLEPNSAEAVPAAIRQLGSYLPSVQLVFKEESKVRRLVGRQSLVNGEQFLECVPNNLEAGERTVRTRLECGRIAAECGVEVDDGNSQRCSTYTGAPTRFNVGDSGLGHISLFLVPE